MKEYIKLINHVLENGLEKKDRTGTGTLSVFGYQSRYDLNRSFPLVTTKKFISSLLFMNCFGFFRVVQI